MAKKKVVKPLFDVKRDFIDSLEAALQAAIMLQLTVKSALDLNAIPNVELAKTLRERSQEFERAVLSTDGD